MSQVSKITGSNRRPNEYYVMIPCSVIKVPRSELDFGARWLLVHIYSFGASGCWQSNETLGRILDVSPRTISLWIANLKKGGYILWIDPMGMQRTVWAKEHPKVKAAQSLPYKGNHVLKSVIVAENENVPPVAQSIAPPGATHFDGVAQSAAPGSRNLLPPTIRSKYRKKLQHKDWEPLSKQECARRRQQQKQDLYSGREGQ